VRGRRPAPSDGASGSRHLRSSLLRIGRGASLFLTERGRGHDGSARRKLQHRTPVEKVIVILGTTVGGWLGWTAGARFGIFAAFVLGIVGTALGLYLGRKIVRDHL